MTGGRFSGIVVCVLVGVHPTYGQCRAVLAILVKHVQVIAVDVEIGAVRQSSCHVAGAVVLAIDLILDSIGGLAGDNSLGNASRAGLIAGVAFSAYA